MKVCVIGTGYVGLTTCCCLAELGHSVTGVDSNKEKIRKLKNYISPIYEPGIQELLKKNKKRLRFTTSIKEGVRKSDVIFIAVNTPPREDGSADMRYVEDVSKKIALSMNSYKVIVEKSTVPVETGKWIKRVMNLYNKKNIPFDVVSNPEFLREGRAIEDFLNPDRIVIGVETERARKIMEDIYKKIKAKKLFTNIETAELIKHASNSFLAMKISYINFISRICEKVGADVKDVSTGMGLDKRIGREFLDAGVGFGGSCFPKDVSAFIWIAKKCGFDFTLLKEVQKINIEQREIVIEKLKKSLWNLNGKKIGILGISFKPNTDDIREAPSIYIIKRLLEEGAKVSCYDPKAMENLKKVYSPTKIKYCKNVYEVGEDSEGIILLTEWDEFKKIDLKKLRKVMRVPVFIDGRNLFERRKMEELGFIYDGIGR